MILLALTCTMVTSVLFGFSRSLGWAFAMRSLQGLSNGNVGIIRTAVAELVPQKELQPRAFSIMPLVWTVGSIFGPSFGGILVHPAERFALFRHSKLFEKYPFALPNVLISILFLFGITVGFLFLRESLEDRKDRRDYGRILGSLLLRPCRRHKKSRHWRRDSQEDEPFLSEPGSEMSTPTTTVNPVPLPRTQPGWASVFSRQSNINLGVYTLLAMHSVAFDQLLPIFMHYPVQSSHDSAVKLPLKFAGGFGIDSSRIGGLFTIYGIFGMLVQFLIFPTFARKYGVLNCLKCCAVTFPFVYVATPFTALLPSDNLRQGVCMVLMFVKGFAGIFSFPCSTILLTNSAASLKILGTLNGVATSISAAGRAAGPALAGATFTVGVDYGYVIVPWWTLAVVSIIGAIPVWWLVEMEGFGGGTNVEDDEEEEEEDEQARTTATPDSIPKRTATAAVGLNMGTIEDVDVVPQEDMAFLSRTTSRTSKQHQHQHRPGSRRESLNLRRIPSPIGLRPQDLTSTGARRYSSDLGATRTGLGTGGTSFQ